MKIDDQKFLRERQYHNSTNLNARVALHRGYSTNPQGWFNWLFQQLDFQPGERILEVGGGPGHLWRTYLPSLPQGCQLFFSDFSAGMVGDARQAMPAERSAVRFTVLDAQSIPFPQDSFDRIIANYMLYHVPDRSRAIAELWRILQPGGTLFAATNGTDHLQDLYRFIGIARGKPVDDLDAERVAFNLQNGAAQLSACFPQIELPRYPDSLRVTQVQPIMDYLLSMWEWSGPNEAQDVARLDALRSALEEQIRRDGAIQIAKDSGLFVAHKAC
jgi:SAM-dependent methyltransferase